MPNTSLSPELCSRIVQFVDVRHTSDLARLCTVSKVFLKEAEPRLYSQLVFGDPRRAVGALRSVVGSERGVGKWVRVFWFVYEWGVQGTYGGQGGGGQGGGSGGQGGQGGPPPLPRGFWETVRAALKKMTGLEMLVLYDHTRMNTWLRLRFRWDANIVSFVRHQHNLELLQVADFVEAETEERVGVGRLERLSVVEAHVSVAGQFLEERGSRLRNVQVLVDRGHVGVLLGRGSGSGGGAGGGGGGGGAVARLPKGLRGLSILDLPEEYAVEVLEAVSVSCPELRALGQFPLPILKRHKFTASLMRLHYLRCIEVDLSSWQPMPVAGAQRALAAELKTFCPSLRWVVVWLQHTRVTWTYGQNEMWVYRVEGNQWRGGGKLWLKT
ncbi:hypothetical protein CC1G_03035 [Coprinopsis cinerea okayama7|uniref:F-box domain-containing protein n=1 Tax=Coprinopsis cinerea (strain Okayama-7 / 130 / ATCC MYA-4618 / FGSC 9003) TaxID=240176 RepID=A8PEN1_COPC7|nr:hypothetical protein CC1G_03035 [Coprinopsis cinerea okayama7\|eukprot:XP_001840806.2 hypothetical protein CC1G_03035 [Coprinopsis cinerea okayama7\